MIEVLNIEAVNKGSLLAKCDVRIAPWQITFRDIKIFEKGANRWIGMPSREFTTEMGEKKYTEMVTFDSENVKSRFRNQIMEAVEAYLTKNPEMTPEPVISETDEFPF